MAEREASHGQDGSARGTAAVVLFPNPRLGGLGHEAVCELAFLELDDTARQRVEATRDKIAAELQRLAQEIFESAVSFDAPVVKILYKNVAPENLRESEFLGVLRTIMLKRRVPPATIDSLFESGQAALETGAFLGG